MRWGGEGEIPRGREVEGVLLRERDLFSDVTSVNMSQATDVRDAPITWTHSCEASKFGPHLPSCWPHPEAPPTQLLPHQGAPPTPHQGVHGPRTAGSHCLEGAHHIHLVLSHQLVCQHPQSDKQTTTAKTVAAWGVHTHRGQTHTRSDREEEQEKESS